MKFNALDRAMFPVLDEAGKVICLCDTQKVAIRQARYYELRSEGKTLEEAVAIMKEEGVEGAENGRN